MLTILSLFRKRALGLQKLLHYVNLFCETYNLTVNLSKSKCITFSGKNKKNNKDTFVIGKNNLDNICEFTYLGIQINAAGSFKSSIDELTTKANKAKYALNNTAKLKRIPIKVALRLFDS